MHKDVKFVAGCGKTIWRWKRYKDGEAVILGFCCTQKQMRLKVYTGTVPHPILQGIEH